MKKQLRLELEQIDLIHNLMLFANEPNRISDWVRVRNFFIKNKNN